jgi:poly(beta-D-mannuronate) C5 epimerase
MLTFRRQGINIPVELHSRSVMSMYVLFKKDNHNNNQFNISKFFRVISLFIISLFAIVSNGLLVQDIDASRLSTARDQGTEAGRSGEKGDNTDDTNRSEHVKVAKSLDTSDSSVNRITTRTAALDPLFCVEFDSLTKEITISCESTNFNQVQKVLNDPDILKNEGDGVWLLNANLTIADGASFTIDSNDIKWLKINSTTSEDAYMIRVIGNMEVDSVKISSWNITSNNYTSTDGEIHRASIAVVPKAGGNANFTNSELSHLGYDAPFRQGLAYRETDGGIIKNSTIHHLWDGFYSRGLSNMVIEDNDIYANEKYGLDPRTGSHDLIIRNNRVHDNNGIGIVCTLDCKNITIEGNEIFGNKIGAVMLSRNIVDSVIANNNVYDEAKGIIISESHNDKVYNNVISNSDVGIEAKSNSSKNNIYNNSILNPAKYGIQIVSGAKENTVSKNIIVNPVAYGICVYNNGTKNLIVENKITNSSKHGICISKEASDNIVKNNSINGAKRYGIEITDANARNNTFYGNVINMTKTGITIDNNTDSTFAQNTISLAKDFEYLITGNSLLKLHNTTFVSDKISSSGGDNNTIMIVGSETILVNNGTGGNATSFDTAKNIYSARLQDPDSIIVTTSK